MTGCSHSLTWPDVGLCVCGHERRLHGREADGTRGLCIRDEWCQCPGFWPYHDDYEECRRLEEAGKP